MRWNEQDSESILLYIISVRYSVDDVHSSYSICTVIITGSANEAHKHDSIETDGDQTVSAEMDGLKE